MPEDFVPIRGNTYPVKDQLKGMGGRWDAEQGCWFVPRSMKMAAEVLAQQNSYEQTMFCFTCGKSFTWAECRERGGDWESGWCGCKT